MQRKDINWPRIFAEGTAIVISILLAFTIDAWWQGQQDAALARAQIKSLVEEIREGRNQLELQGRKLEMSLSGTIRFLELMEPNASEDALPEARIALKNSFDIGVFSPPQGMLHEVLASRSKAKFVGLDTWARLQDWVIVISDMEVDGRHLENNREELFVAAVTRLGIPLSAIIRGLDNVPTSNDRFDLPESTFEVDTSALLRDTGVVTVFTMRAIRTQLLLQGHNDALRIANEIIEQLE